MDYTFTIEELLMGGGRVGHTGDPNSWMRGQAPPTHVIYKIGVYGWRKRCLYAIILTIILIVIINLALTIWIIQVMDFTVNGMGKLRIVKNGIIVQGQAEFYGKLYATRIRSRKNHTLQLQSSRNITLTSRNTHGHITNKLVIGSHRIESYAKRFEIKTVRGDQLFYADDNSVRIGARQLNVTGSGGTTFQHSIQTPLLHSKTGNLRIESPTGGLYISGPTSLNLKSSQGPINLRSQTDLILSAQIIHLDASRISFPNLTISSPRFDGRPYPTVFQLCVCGSTGVLFLAPSRGNCQATRDICR